MIRSSRFQSLVVHISRKISSVLICFHNSSLKALSTHPPRRELQSLGRVPPASIMQDTIKLRYFLHAHCRIIELESIPHNIPDCRTPAWEEELGSICMSDLVHTMAFYFPLPDGTRADPKESEVFCHFQAITEYPFWQYFVVKKDTSQAFAIFRRPTTEFHLGKSQIWVC